MRLKTFAAAAISVLTLVSADRATGAVIPLDDFSDCNDTGWMHLDNTTGHPWGPTTFDASNCEDYTLRTSGPVPPDPPPVSDVIGSRLNASSDPEFKDGFLRAKMRPNEVETNFGLWTRHVDGTGSTYFFYGRTHDDTFNITRIDNATIQPGGRLATIPLSALDPVRRGFSFGEDWMMQAGMVGDRLSLKVWRDGEPEPASPQLTVVDGTYPAGGFGVFVSGVLGERSVEAPLSATFDEIVFITPPAGDTDADGDVDIDDLNNVRNNFGGNGLGDSDGDGDVDIDDLNAVRNNFGAGMVVVPEPGAGGLAVCGLAWLVAALNRRRGFRLSHHA